MHQGILFVFVLVLWEWAQQRTMSRPIADRNDSPTHMSLRSSKSGPEKLLISAWRMRSAEVCEGEWGRSQAE